jgi:ribosomal protein L11 methyltransferase
VGCGSGVLALAAAKLGLEARGTDVDEPSVRDAARNARANGLVATFDSTPVHELDEPADLVLANLHAELIVRLAPELIRLTGHWLVLAGVLADREPLVKRALAPLELVHREQDGEWVSLRYRRTS